MDKVAGQVTNVDQVNMDAGAFLKEIAGGSCSHEFTQGLEKVVQGVRETGKKGKIDLKLSLEPFKGDPNRIVVSYDVNANAPKPAKPVSMFFSTTRNTLQRKDPNQVEMEFGE